MGTKAPLLLLVGLAACGRSAPGAVTPAAAPEYIDSRTCAECHPREWETWTDSHHDLAMQPAEAESVLGDFDDARFEQHGVVTRFFRRDGGFWVHTQDADGELRDFEVAYTFGVEPLQQYLVEFPGGRLQCLTIAWDVESERWFSLYPDVEIPAGDALHWTGRYQTWNAMCADCHSTRLEKGYDPASDTYATSWHEIDVGCQACHGPGSAHADWARAEEERSGASESSSSKGLVVALERHGAAEQLDVCATCHSRRAALVREPDPAAGFLERYRPERVHAGLYHADGQILDEVYVWGSFVQSRMHAAGVACTDCHDPHSLDLLTPGNSLCAQCHSDFAPRDRFPTLKAAEYDTPEHHFHEPGSAGAQCVSCHMPERTYMVVDPRRDHGFRVPRPDLGAELGTPDACTGCHADRTAEWATEELAKRFGPPDAKSTTARFARVRLGLATRDELLELIGDAEAAGILRATAVDLLRPLGPGDLSVLATLLADEDPLVRGAAAAALGSLPFEQRAPFALGAPGAPGALADSNREVRIQAARALAPLEASNPELASHDAYVAGRAEFVEAQVATADLPGGRLNLAVLYEETGEAERAEAEYTAALAMDPLFVPAIHNLANLLNRAGRNAEALEVLAAGVEGLPNDGELRYSYGLLLAEEERWDEAGTQLSRAAGLLPRRGRVQYNAGLALQRAGRLSEAEGVLLSAQRLEPESPELLHALVLLQIELEAWEEAERWLAVMQAQIPGAPILAQLSAELERARSE